MMVQINVELKEMVTIAQKVRQNINRSKCCEPLALFEK